MIHTDPTKRHDFVLLFDVKDGNPNGDPDADNLPRFDRETKHGLVTDVAIKRKIRDYVAGVLGKPIFIQSKVALNQLIFDAFKDAGVEPARIPLTKNEIDDEELVGRVESLSDEGFSVDEGHLIYSGDTTKQKQIASILVKDLESGNLSGKLRTLAGRIAKALAGTNALTPEIRDNARGKLCQRYFDIRMFGAVLSTGLNAGQVRGPMQLTFARSIDPIFPMDMTITRQARTTAERMATGSTEMGRKPIVPYGLYRAHGFFNPLLAKQTGVTKEDLDSFWEALCHLFDFDRSAARGEMSVRGIYVFSHDNEKGNAPAHKLFERVKVKNGIKSPRSFEDYGGVTIDKEDMPTGVTPTLLCHETGNRNAAN